MTPSACCGCITDDVKDKQPLLVVSYQSSIPNRHQLVSLCTQAGLSKIAACCCNCAFYKKQEGRPCISRLSLLVAKHMSQKPMQNRKRTSICIMGLDAEEKETKNKNGQRSVPTATTSQGETALTVCMTRLRGQLHSILENMDNYSATCLEELADLMTLWNVEPRVEENQWETPSVDELITQFRQMCEDAEDRARDAQEKAQERRLEAFEDVVQQIRRSNY
ncbi:hypothetical protein Tco_1224785 [Tanacetum coccineum]